MEKPQEHNLTRREFVPQSLGLLACISAIVTNCAKNAAIVLADKIAGPEFNNRDFITRLKKIKELSVIDENIILSKNPESSVIIILADQHRSPEIEETELALLNKNLGVDFVGMEGLSADTGQKAPTIAVSEIDLKKLQREGKFRVIGLEDPIILEKMSKLYLAWYYVKGYLAAIKSEPLKHRQDLNENEKERLAELRADLNESWRKIKYLYRDVFKIDLKNLDFIDQILPEFGFSKRDLKRKPDESEEDRISRIELLEHSLECKTSPLNNASFWLDDRNKAGARFMVEGMKKANAHAGAMIFGAFHAPGLMEEIQKLGDFTIVMLYNEKDEEDLMDTLDVLSK